MRQLMNGCSLAISGGEKKKANIEDTNKINQSLLLSSKPISYCCIAYPSGLSKATNRGS